MAARVAAPLAFLFLVSLGVVAVRAALVESPPSSRPATTATVETGPETQPTTSTTATTETTGTTAGTFYRVRSGDTLESIASRSGTSVVRLLELNPGIDPVALRIGQRIRVG